MSGNRIPYRRRQLYMKLISLFLVFSMCFGIVIIGDMSVSGEGDDQETDGGFSIDLKWSGDAVDDQVYDYDSDKKESRYVRLKVSYRNDCLLSDYDAGDIMIVVPGIDDAGRVPRIVPKAIAADMSTDLEKVYDWSYTYNQARNEYTFTNNGALTKDFVFEGMFEIIWEINSRETVNGYSKNISASLTTSQGEVATSNTIIYRQERYKDEYVFRDYDPTSKICSSEGIDNLIDRAGGKTSADYYFVKYSNFPYNFTRKSLGLTTYNEYTYDSLRSDWNVWLPAGVNLCGVDGKVNTDDAIFKKTGEVRTLEDGNQYECWTTKNKYATNTYGSGLTFYVAYPRDQFTGDATVRVEGVGRYRDDTADTIYAFKDYTVDVTNYEFRYEGDSFYATKRCYGVHNSYTDFHCGNCYSYGAVNAAHLSGGNYDYNSYLRFSLLDRRVSDDEKITLEIGDDILKVKTVNGTLRTLGDDEYHFSNVYIPSMAGFLNINDLKLQLKDYQAEIYVRIANSSSLVLYDTVTVGTAAKSVAFNRDDIVGVSVRIKDFDQTLKNFEIRLTHRFHTSAGDIQYLNGDGEFYNYMYIRLFDSEGNWINRIENNTNYPPNFDSQYDFDEESFVEQLKFEFDVEKIPDTGSVNDLIDYFSSKSEKIKKIVLFHVIYLIDSDQYLSENETEAFNYLTDQFELGSDIVDSAKELVKDVMDVNLRLSEYIM